MSNNGLCKVAVTEEERNAVIAYYDNINKQYKDCRKQMSERIFYKRMPKQFLFFKWSVEWFDERECEDAFPELFNHASLINWGDDCGGYSIWTDSSYDSFCDVVRLFKTKGEVYLTPKQCTLFRDITTGRTQ
jgi:hypothetical protein